MASPFSLVSLLFICFACTSNCLHTAVGARRARGENTSAHAPGCSQCSVRGLSHPFSIVVLPDTQYYSKYARNSGYFTKQTEWILKEAQNPTSLWNIKFVTHLGDLVNDGWNVDQWKRADASMSVLAPPGGPYVVPFSVLPGNHDFQNISRKETGSANYLTYFGPHRFAGAPWYGGADTSGRNSFQLFEAGGFHFLHLALEWMPEDNVGKLQVSPLQWASKVLDDHPGNPVILSTHEYINDEPAGRSSTGDAVFNQFVKKHDAIFLVLSGHFHNLETLGEEHAHTDDGEWHQVSKNDMGRDVVEVLQDYQDYPHGGDGWLRIITFDAMRGEMRFETYSPALEEFQSQTVQDHGQRASRFSIPLNLTQRLYCGGLPHSKWRPFGHGSPVRGEAAAPAAHV